MCGIVGTVGKIPGEGVRDAALAAIAHRGPDGAGEATNGTAWFGHRRLSIIDLSEAARQPMVRPGAGTLAFNGEIYDHARHRSRLQAEGIPFESESDTELLLRGLASEGPGFVSRLHGMWAFAYASAAADVVLLGRDHAGMKPLYVWEGPGCLAFASELRALCILMRGLGGEVRADLDGLADFLRFGSVSEPRTFVCGVRMVPPDEVWRVDASGSVVERRPLSRRPEPCSGTRMAVEAAVERHLVADVPVAIFLSGGIDSGVIAAAASRIAGPRPTAITVELGSKGTADEYAIAGRLAARLGLRFESVPLADWVGSIPPALEAFDQPSVDGLNTFVISKIAHSLGFKVALSGVGADEVYGGYGHLRREAGLGWPRPPAPVMPLVRAAVARVHSVGPIRGRRVACLLDGWARGERPTRSARRLLPETLVGRLLPGLAPASPPQGPRDVLELERSTYLRDTLLRDTDVMGMANGLEIRAPFLDPVVLQDGREIGTGALLSRGRAPKWPLRDGWRTELEPASVLRPKSGFTLGLRDWLAGPGRERLEAALTRLPRWRCFEAKEAGRLVSSARRSVRSGHPASFVLPFLAIQLDAALERFGEP